MLIQLGGKTADLAIVVMQPVTETEASTWGFSHHAKIVDNALNTTMRTITGTLKSTPLPWLPVMANIAPLDLRRPSGVGLLLTHLSVKLKHAVVGHMRSH